MGILDYLRDTFRLADAFDIAFVTLFIYALLSWFRTTTSRPVVIGIGILTGTYLAARAFDMYMTAAIFQAGLAFAAVAIIVVFQEDLRRVFARIAAVRKFSRGRVGDGTDFTTDILVQTVFELARKKVGGLLVLRGAEPIDRLTSGGTVTDARISRALLDSIFDPHSLGHDGAVVIENNRIAQFAAHLPLSRSNDQLGARGTRHSAALGLSEACDALVLVVSEERGEVSIAHNGQLEPIQAPSELKAKLENFVSEMSPEARSARKRQLILRDPVLKIASVVIAIIVWLSVSVKTETIQKTFVVPIDYRNLPDNLDIDDAAPTEARVTLSGYERAFNFLAPGALRISLDLSKVQAGRQELVIDETNIKVPSNLVLFRALPRVVSISVHRWVPGRARVEVQTEGELPRSLTLGSISASPEILPVEVWSSLNMSTVSIRTEPVALSHITESREFLAKVILPQYVRLEGTQSSEVRVRIEIEPAVSAPTVPGDS